MNTERQNQDEWKKFIQVNIYGRTIDELEQNGVDLKNLLHDIGCSKYWITEGSMYNGDSDSGLDSSFDETIPMFSTTIANTKFPRYSTPAPSRMNSKMTLCTSKIISRISENSEEYDLSQEVEEQLDSLPASIKSNNSFNQDENATEEDSRIIRDLMEKVLKEVEASTEKSIVQPETKETVFGSYYDNGLTEDVTRFSEYPRCSTPIDFDTRRNPFFCPSNSVSIINLKSERMDTATAEEKDNNENTQLVNVCEKLQSVLDGISEVVENEKVVGRTSDSSMFQNEHTEKSVDRTNRSTLKRTTSEIERGRKKAIRMSRRKTIHPMLPSVQSIEKFKNSTSVNVSEPTRIDSIKVYRDLVPVCSAVENNNHDEWLQMPPVTVYDNLGEDFEDHQNVEKETENGDEESNQGYEWADAPETFNTSNDSSNTVDISPTYENDLLLEENKLENYSDRSSFVPERRPQSILVRSSKTEPKTNKKVSFAIQAEENVETMTPNQYKNYINKSRLIKCQFEGCRTTYQWKIKYGKLRLVDHALTHTTKRAIRCQLCNVTTQTVRQMRHHYDREHENRRMTGYGMKTVFSLPVDEGDVREIWNICYKDQIHIVGEASKKPHHTRMKRDKVKEADEEIEVKQEKEFVAEAEHNDNEDEDETLT